MSSSILVVIFRKSLSRILYPGPTRHWPRLSLAHSCHLTDQALASIAEGCPRLTTLDPQDCDGVTAAGVELLRARCRHMVSLNVHGCRRLVCRARETGPALV